MELTIKKVKEVKGYAKADVKRFIRNQDRYPEGIKVYYEGLLAHSKAGEARLKAQFRYTDKSLEERAEIYHEAFWQSYNWWQNKLIENDGVMAKYNPIFREAEALAQSVDVSDIKDGFPCGSATLYLKAEAKNTPLGKVLRSQYSGDSYSAKVCHGSAYRIPVKIPSYGQCIEFDKRICDKVAEFLNSKGIPTGVYSYID